MKSLKGFAVKQLKNGENGETVAKHHPVEGTSFKIGSGFLCHLVVKELSRIHFDIVLNDNNQVRRSDNSQCVPDLLNKLSSSQVEIRNISPTHPLHVNGEPVLDKALLVVGDTIEVLSERFVWERLPASEELNDDLESSFQVGELRSIAFQKHNLRSDR